MICFWVSDNSGKVDEEGDDLVALFEDVLACWDMGDTIWICGYEEQI